MIPTRAADVVVVGAGAAGLHAAVQAADGGASVLLLDADVRPGGQYHRQLPVEFGAVRPERAHHEQPAAADLIARLARHRRVTQRQQVTVWAAEPRVGGGALLHLADVSSGRAVDAGVIAAPRVVLATGAYDRTLPFPGSDLPGVYTPGAARSLLQGARIVPGHRVLVAGTGPFLLPVAAGLIEAGARLAGVLEANHTRGWVRRPRAMAFAPEKVAEAARYTATLTRHRTRVRAGRAVVAVQGDGRVQTATVAKLKPDWTIVPGSEKTIETDAVVVGYGFVPQLELALALGCDTEPGPDGSPVVAVDDAQLTSRPGVYAAGELTGVGGAVLAAAEGALAGLATALDLGTLGERGHAARAAAWQGARARYRRFADALAAVYPVPDGWQSWLADDTVVCRCERVRYGAVRDAVAAGATGLGTVCAATGCGQGRCQGRSCGTGIAELTATLSGVDGPAELPDPLALSVRPVDTPIPLGELADDPDRPE
ncbi:FAD/NAD(P)-binding oxidoreductase [Actinocatenispora sera]|uniref:FAD/NAD(P)-dependent oxidoreductase n=1 Tax=Actinocatenispora sera TaxID=390989 RepID=UPI0033EE0522